MKQSILLALKGMAMGMAEVVPGVSGGTIAFITGIYEELLDTIKGLTPNKLLVLKNEGFKSFWSSINGNFLLYLLVGMATGLVLGVFTIAKLLVSFPILVWSFFFGLIVASVWYVGKQINRWRIQEVLLFLLSAALSYYITIAAPSEGPQELWFVFISGFIAICALMLPGVSGSFLLLLLGMYQYIVTDNVKALLSDFNTDSLLVVAVFALGCLSGLLSFSRVLSWTFKKYKSPTLAVLTGFLLGSLNKVWPWKHVESIYVKHLGEIDEKVVTITERSVLPANHDAFLREGANIVGYQPADNYLIGAIIMMAVGFFLLFAMEKMNKSEA
ncbi:MAG: putative membrane protein [Chitinophagales bacterium]|jgi:putative membrane protein